MSEAHGAPGGQIAAPELCASPQWLVLELGAECATLLQLDEAAYAAASFLDQRLLAHGYRRAQTQLTQLSAAAAQLHARLHFIFHIGHVGSTLLARLIGARTEAFFVLREPAPLRAATTNPLQLPLLLPLLARTWRAPQRAVVKVTSFVSELAVELLRASESARALFMYVDPATYLRSILIGDNSRAEALALAAARRARLLRRLALPGWPYEPRSEGEQVALSWLCEMLTLHQAEQRASTPVMWLHFDAFLREPRHHLGTVLRMLGDEPTPQVLEHLLRSPIMSRYSKAPEHAYDAALRRDLLATAEQTCRTQIHAGLRWLERMAESYPAVAELIEHLARLERAA